MAERIYKGTATVNGVTKPVTYKIVNAPESRANDLEILRRNHGDKHHDMRLTHVYDSDKPTAYASVGELSKMPELSPELLRPIEAKGAEPNPGNVPPREASIPPANAPTGDVQPKPQPIQISAGRPVGPSAVDSAPGMGINVDNPDADESR